jgi:hypothetical protein
MLAARPVRRAARAAALGTAAVGLLLGTPSAAQAAAPGPAAGGLTLTVRAGDPLAPAVVLTNRGPADCQVATTALGTIALTRVEQDGVAVQPILVEPGFDEPVQRAVADRLRTLRPGGSVQVRLQTVPAGPTRHAVEVAPWSGGTAVLGMLYPVRPDRPLRLEAHYAWSVPPATGPPLCGAAAGSADSPATGTATGGRQRGGVRWPAWAALGGALLLTALVALLLVRRRAGRVAAVLLVAAGTLAGQAWQARPAQARFLVDDTGLQQAFDDCMAVLRQPGHDPAGILPTLERAGVNVHLVVPIDGVNHENGAWIDGMPELFIYWNPGDRHAYAGSGGTADPCSTLYHEMFHAYQDAQGPGVQDHHECFTADGKGSGIGINEVLATRAQNLLRVALGMSPRSHYGDDPLPPGDCRPSQPTDPVCTESGCARSSGEPHLRTFDGRRYDFQAVGEFVAAHGDGYGIQVRQQPLPGSRRVAVNTAVAMDVAGDRVEVRLVDGTPVLFVAGAARTDAVVPLPKGGTVALGTGSGGPLVTVTWPDGSTAWVTAFAGVGLDLTAQPAAARAGHLDGLLGDFDGDPGNDVRPRGGAALADPTFQRLYPGLADSWRVTAATSLFGYPAGSDTGAYTDRTFPDQPATAGTVPDPAAAEAVCRRLGVTDPQVLPDCILDVGLTGLPAFADAARAGQDAVAVLSGQAVLVPGTADIYRAGRAPVADLPGGAGTPAPMVPVDVSAGGWVTFPAVTGLVGPAGSLWNGADGGTDFPSTDIPAFNGLSGVRHETRTLFLVGVFVPAPATAPATADASRADAATQARPALGELFHIGDGRSTDGTVQRFAVPAGATALYVGFADASVFHGPPGFYADNIGTLLVRAALHP